MKIVKQSYEILSPMRREDFKADISLIEMIARTCYKSEDKMSTTEEDQEKFFKKLITMKHESMLEHGHISVKFITSRRVADHLLRHRLSSFAQESTRYCNYSLDKFDNEVKMILPRYLDDQYIMWTKTLQGLYETWCESCLNAEQAYFKMLSKGASAEQAADVLPLSTKTELVVTTNYREWRHILKLRSDNAAAFDTRALIRDLATELKEIVPYIFDDIYW